MYGVTAAAGSFLFAGPTGVGKTELAKALAAELFDNEHRNVGEKCSSAGKAEGTSLQSMIVTLPETNIARENRWLEHSFPFGAASWHLPC